MTPPRRPARWLWLCTLLFAVRVAAQPAALWISAPLLPRFDAWHGNVLPYPLLLLSQIVLLLTMIWTAARLGSGRLTPRKELGYVLVGFGILYTATMVARLVLGATVLSDRAWFARPLPTVFHLVLASFVLVLGRFHLVHAGEVAPGRNTQYESEGR